MKSILTLLLVLAAAGGTSGLPQFDNFPAAENYKGVLKRVDLESDPDARMFRTRLRDNEGSAPNFAGRYIVTLWGCGTSCQTVAIIDAKNGKVSFPLEEAAGYGVCYQRDSRLLVVNPLTAEDVGPYMPEWLRTIYYEWDGQQLKRLAESREPMSEPCEEP